MWSYLPRKARLAPLDAGYPQAKRMVQMMSPGMQGGLGALLEGVTP